MRDILQLSAHFNLLNTVWVNRYNLRGWLWLIMMKPNLFSMDKEIRLFLFIKPYVKALFANEAERLNCIKSGVKTYIFSTIRNGIVSVDNLTFGIYKSSFCRSSTCSLSSPLSTLLSFSGASSLPSVLGSVCEILNTIDKLWPSNCFVSPNLPQIVIILNKVLI